MNDYVFSAKFQPVRSTCEIWPRIPERAGPLSHEKVKDLALSQGLACEIAVTSEKGDASAVVLRGQVTICNAAQLHELATSVLQDEHDLVVSCEELVQLDASALQILLALQRELGMRGRTLQMLGLSHDLCEMLQLAGVDNALLDRTATKPA